MSFTSSAHQVDRDAFLRALAGRFPSIAQSIGDLERGLLHAEMGVVSDATRTEIAVRNWESVKEHFSFIAEVFVAADDAVRNAVYVSYLENVLLGETAEHFAQARAMLPPVLVQAMAELEEHFEKLARYRRDT